MLPEEAYFSVQETLTSPTPDWTKRSNYSSAPPQPLPPKKGSAFFGNTWPHCVLYFSKNQRSQPLYRRICQRRRSASSRKQRIGIEGVNPQANSLPIISKTKSNSNSRANPIPHPPSPTKCLQFAMAVGASCHPKTIASRTVLSLSHAT